jgi:hypothetical protein
MKEKLTQKQRKFLQYLIDEHNCVGMYGTIRDILRDGNYDPSSQHLKMIVSNFQCLLEEKRTGTNSHTWCTISKYNEPMKYLRW